MGDSIPLRGEIWEVDLNPTQGREQAGQRPALVVSADQFNRSRAELVIVLPITSQDKGIPFHVRIDKREGGVMKTSFVKPEDVRSISKDRLIARWGKVSPATLHEVEDRLRLLFNI